MLKNVYLWFSFSFILLFCSCFCKWCMLSLLLLTATKYFIASTNILVTHFSKHRYKGYHLLAAISNATVVRNILLHLSFWRRVLIFPRYIPDWITRYSGVCVYFHYVLIIILCWGYLHLHFLQEFMRIPVSSDDLQNLVLSSFKNIEYSGIALLF